MTRKTKTAITTRKAGSRRRRTTPADWRRLKALLDVIDDHVRQVVDIVRTPGLSPAQVLHRAKPISERMVRECNKVDPTFMRDIGRKEKLGH